MMTVFLWTFCAFGPTFHEMTLLNLLLPLDCFKIGTPLTRISLFPFFSILGLLHDHPHHTGAGVFIRELREQCGRLQLWRLDHARHWNIPAGKVRGHRLRQQGNTRSQSLTLVQSQYYLYNVSLFLSHSLSVFRTRRPSRRHEQWSMPQRSGTGCVATFNIVVSPVTTWPTRCTASSQAEGHCVCP